MRKILIPTLLATLLLSGPIGSSSAADVHKAVEGQLDVVVKLFGAGVGNLDSYGSGVLISEQGHIATVWNHLVNSGFLTAVMADGRRYSVEVVGTSLEHDLAVLKLISAEDVTFPFVDPRQSADVRAGAGILAFSNVYHVATGKEPVSVMHGVVAAETKLEAGFGRWRLPVTSPVFILDAITNNSGAAGGLVTTIDGQPLGLLGRELRHQDTDMWVNYAVPWKTLSSAITSIIQGRRMEPSSTDPANNSSMTERQLTSRFGLTMLPSVLEKTPAYVDRVVPGSPSSIAGLQRNDLVLLVEESVIQSVHDLHATLGQFRAGQKITVTVNRDGMLQVLQLRIPQEQQDR